MPKRTNWKALLTASLIPMALGCGNAPPDGTRKCDVDAPCHAGPPVIDRDALGTPYVYAEKLDDAAYAIGYAMTLDQTAGVVAAYLEASGQLAKYRGKSLGQFAVATDLQTKTLAVLERSAAIHPKLPADVRSYLDAFTAGANRALDERRANFPWIGAYKVEPVHVLALTRLRNIQSQLAVATGDIAASLKPNPTCPAPIYEDASKGQASNAWAVTGSMTPNGETILCGDPHTPWALDPTSVDGRQFAKYEVHAVVAGRRMGGTFQLGTPMLGPGYTRDLAWSGTHSGADIADAYHLDGIDPATGSYQVGNERKTLTKRTITVEVEGTPAVTMTAYDSVFGPVACIDQGKPTPCSPKTLANAYGLVLPSLDSDGPFAGSVALLGAENIDAVIPLLALQENDEKNFMMAARDGEILYHLAARMPVRSADVCYGLAFSSANPATLPLWDAGGRMQLASMADHPTVRAKDGYLVNNNVPPQFARAGLHGAELPWHRGLYDRAAQFDPDSKGPRQRRARGCSMPPRPAPSGSRNPSRSRPTPPWCRGPRSRACSTRSSPRIQSS
jgi:acyl-homoserine lactone acylase PvdQ